MNRTEKAKLIDGFAKQTGGKPFLVITEFRGTKVSEVTQLRKDLEKNGMSFRVMKNTLAKRAFVDLGVAGLESHLKGMTGVIVSGPDPIASARVLKDLLKPLATIKVRAGYFEDTVMPGDAVKVVSELPGREELLGRLLATLLEGPRQLLRVINGPGRELAQVLKNHEDKLAGGES